MEVVVEEKGQVVEEVLVEVEVEVVEVVEWW